MRAKVALAAADLDDKAAGHADVDAAFAQAGAAGNGAPPWLLLRLMRIGERAKIAPDTMQPIAAMIADPALRGRAELSVLRADLADPKQSGDVKLMDAVEAKTVSAWLARAEWARRTTPARRAWSRAGTGRTARSACSAWRWASKAAIEFLGEGVYL